MWKHWQFAEALSGRGRTQTWVSPGSVSTDKENQSQNAGLASGSCLSPCLWLQVSLWRKQRKLTGPFLSWVPRAVPWAGWCSHAQIWGYRGEAQNAEATKLGRTSKRSELFPAPFLSLLTQLWDVSLKGHACEMWLVGKWRRDWMATHTHLPSPSFCCALENVYRTTQLSKQMSKALCSQESLQITLDFAKIETATRIHFTLPEKKIAPRIIHACNVLVFYALCNYELILRRTQWEITMATPKWQASFFQEKEWLPLPIKDLTTIVLDPYQTHRHL